MLGDNDDRQIENFICAASKFTSTNTEKKDVSVGVESFDGEAPQGKNE